VNDWLTRPAFWAAVLSVLWLGAVLRIPALRRSARQRTGPLMLLLITLSATLTAPGVRHALDTASGVPDLSILLGHLCILLAMIFLLKIVAMVTGAHDRVLRAGAAAFALVMAILVVLFGFLPRRLDRPDFGLWQGQHPAVIAYQMVFQTGLGAGLLITSVFLFRHWRTASRMPIRTALLLLWLGSVLGLVYVLGRMGMILVHGLVMPLNGRQGYSGVVLLSFYASLLTAAAGALTGLAYAAGRYLRRLTGYHRLRPLWELLTAAAPETVLQPPPHPLVDLFSIASLELRLYRRIVEIRDAQLELTSYVAPELRAAASAALRHAGRDADPALDACTLLMALRLKQNGAPGAANPGTASWSAEGSVDGEVRTLLALAGLIRSPAVAAAAAVAWSSTAATTGSSGSETDTHGHDSA
jgi:hypothetical protein